MAFFFFFISDISESVSDTKLQVSLWLAKLEIERCHRQRMVSPRALPDTEICTKTLTSEFFQKYPISPPKLLMDKH